MGAAASLAIADSIRVFASFESSMLRIKALTGATGQEFQALGDLAKELGSTTAFTAREAADAMGFLARAGFEVDEIMKGIPSVLNLAAAGELELATAAEIASNTLRGFGLEASEMDRVANVLAAGAAKSNTSVEALGEAFKMVSSDAKGMGLSIEETTAFLGALANVGVKGTMGGTALRVVFAQMGQEILAQGGLLPALKALDKDGVAAVVNAMSDLGIRAGSSAVKLANQIPVVEKLTQELGTLDNFAGDMAETMLSGLTGSTVKAGSAFEGLRIKLGETFEQFGVGFFEELTLTFQTLNEVLGNMKGQFGDLNSMGKDVAQTFLLVAESIGLAVTATVDLVEKLIGVQSAFNAIFQMVFDAKANERLGLRMDLGFDLGTQMKRAGALTEGFERTGKLEELILRLSAALDPLSRTPDTPDQEQKPMRDLSSFEEMSKFLTESERRQLFPEKFPAQETVEEITQDTKELDQFLEGMAALPEDVMMMMERRGLGQFAEQLLASEITEGDLAKLGKLLDQSEILRGDPGIFEEVRDAILESFIDIPEPEKKEPDPVQGFAETIDTVLGQVRVDPLAGKKDSQNLDTIAKASQRTARALESSGGAFS